jgi:hypothetical protein
MSDKIISISLSGDVEAIEKGLSYLTDDLSINITAYGYPVKAIRADAPTLEISADKNGAVITYFEKCQFFRAMGLLLEHMRDGAEIISIKEAPRFKMNGAMIDMAQCCSSMKNPRYLLRKINKN